MVQVVTAIQHSRLSEVEEDFFYSHKTSDRFIFKVEVEIIQIGNGRRTEVHTVKYQDLFMNHLCHKQFFKL